MFICDKQTVQSVSNALELCFTDIGDYLDLICVVLSLYSIISTYIYTIFNGKIGFEQVQRFKANGTKILMHINMDINKNYYKMIKNNKDKEEIIKMNVYHEKNW